MGLKDPSLWIVYKSPWEWLVFGYTRTALRQAPSLANWARFLHPAPVGPCKPI